MPDIPVRKCIILIPDNPIVDFEKLLTFSEYRMKNCNVKINYNKTSKAIYFL